MHSINFVPNLITLCAESMSTEMIKIQYILKKS
jgi:hypothetical protein